MTSAFVFPGQGSQSVGMGKALHDASPAAREVFQEVDDALGQKLSALMFDGPAEELMLTANAQPAIMAVAIAMLRVAEREAGLRLVDHAELVAGHSLGEYSALCAAGTFDLAQTARLLRLRGEAMQAAVPVGQGAMAALLGLDLDVVQKLAGEAAAGSPDGKLQVCAPANDNAPGQVVISGHVEAVERAIGAAKALGSKRAMLLPVSAPFHCALMQPAADAMATALAAADMRAPVLPVLTNVTATPVSDVSQLRTLLVEQVTAMVRWRESIEALPGLGVDTVVECGSGKVLTGLIRRIVPDLTTFNLQSMDDIEAYLAR